MHTANGADGEYPAAAVGEGSTHVPRGAARVRAAFMAAVQGLPLTVLSLGGSLALLVLTLLSVALIPLGVGVIMTPVVLTAVRSHATLRRRLARDWAGIEAPSSYGTPPPGPTTGPRGALRHCRHLLSDPATWRDVRWLGGDATAGFLTALLPVGLFFYGLYGPVLALGAWRPIARLDGGEWYTFLHVTSQQDATLAAGVGTVLFLLSLWINPAALRGHFTIARRLLASGQG